MVVVLRWVLVCELEGDGDVVSEGYWVMFCDGVVWVFV